MKVIVGLGNPGPEYDATRHNVGWWVLDRLAYDWELPEFERQGQVLLTQGRVGDEPVLLMKPLTYVNRSGHALTMLVGLPDFDPEEDLLDRRRRRCVGRRSSALSRQGNAGWPQRPEVDRGGTGIGGLSSAPYRCRCGSGRVEPVGLGALGDAGGG